MTGAGSLDANVVLRLLLNDVPEQHELAIALFRMPGTLTVSDTALIETIFVLGRAYELTRTQQAEAILGLIRRTEVAASMEPFERAFALFLAHPKLSFEDCFLVVAADKSGNPPLWTFDKKLSAQTDAQLLTARATNDA